MKNFENKKNQQIGKSIWNLSIYTKNFGDTKTNLKVTWMSNYTLVGKFHKDNVWVFV